MDTIILSIAVILEAAFAARSIITKSNQGRLRNFMRVGAFAAFVLFTLVTLIQWSFRWYGLALLLFIWAAVGTWALMRRMGEREFSAGRTVFKAIGTLLLIVLVMIPALVFPQYKPPRVTGRFEVATVNFTYTDTSRIETFTDSGENRRVNVEFWYPVVNGNKYPLVVFSHGLFGMKGSNTSTFIELASHGYVVCSIDHPYHSFFTKGTDGRRTIIDNTYLQEYLDVMSGKYDEAAKLKLEQKWMKLRTDDMSFVLDTVLGQTGSAAPEEVYQRIDPGKIGLMGHSLGGESSAQLARQRNDIDAVIDLDADLAGEYLEYVDGRAVMNQEVYPVPFLVIFSDTLTRLIEAVPHADTVVAVKHITATAPNAFEVHLTGTDHMSLTDLPLISPFLVTMINSTVPKAGGGHTADALATIEKMNDIVLEFFNVYLKGQGSFSDGGTY